MITYSPSFSLSFRNLPPKRHLDVCVSIAFRNDCVVDGSAGFHHNFHLRVPGRDDHLQHSLREYYCRLYLDIHPHRDSCNSFNPSVLYAYTKMTGSRRRSSRLHAVSPKGDDPAYNEMQSAPNGNHEGGNTHRGEANNIKNSEAEAISGVRRNTNDDGLDFYYTNADKWIPVDQVAPESLRAWTESQIPPPRPSPEPELDSEVKDVRIDSDVGLMVYYRKGGKDKAGDLWPFEWVSVDAASSQTTSSWAKTEKKRIEKSMRYLNAKNVSLAKKRLLMLEDLLDGDIIEPDWTSESPSPNPHIEIPPHAPHYPLPTPRKGHCGNTTHPSSSLAHTNLVAACQASKHSFPRLVCTACHEYPPI
jgi:hypothetical protein